VIHASELTYQPYQPVNSQGVTFRFDPSNLTVGMFDKHGNWFYEIDLERARNSAELLDWILQVALKRVPQFSPAVVGDLICALEDTAYEVFGTNLQGIYCPHGHDRTVDWRASQPNNPQAYHRLSRQQREALQAWITTTFAPGTRAHPLTSYTWKHRFEGSESGFYLTNGAFKGAMLAAGYQPTKQTAKDINWRFRVKLIRQLTEKECNAV